MLVSNKPLIDKNPGDALSTFVQPVEFPGFSEIEPDDRNTPLARICTMPPAPPAEPEVQLACV